MTNNTLNVEQKIDEISSDLKDHANGAQQRLQNLFNQNKNLSNAEIVQHLRLGIVVATALMAFVLITASDSIGLVGLVAPFALTALNLYLTGKRWYNQVDGRYDVQTMVNSQNIQEKARHGLVVFAGPILALLVHFLAPKITSGIMLSTLFTLADFAAILLSGVCAGYEVFEGLKIEKNRRRSSINPAAWYNK